MHKDVTVRVALTIAGLSLPLFDVRELVENLFASVSILIWRQRSDKLVKQFDHGLLLTCLLRQVIEVLRLCPHQSLVCLDYVCCKVMMGEVQVMPVSM